jgi:phage terminase large subunit-like protein
VEEAAREGKPITLALVAETKADTRDVLLQGESGLLRISPPWFYPNYEPSKRRLTWPDGSYAILFSGDEPNQLRGPQFHKAWVDEWAKYQYPEQTLDMLEYGLRLGENPQMVVTTTPRPLPELTTMMQDPQTRVSTVSSYANIGHLSSKFIQRVVRRHEGTRLGEQEIHAKILSATPGALWSDALLDLTRTERMPALETFRRMVVAIDPAVSKGEDDRDEELGIGVTGIAMAGLHMNGHAYVIRDASGFYSPNEWALMATNLYVNYGCDRIVGERNQGGDMVAHTIYTVDRNLPVRLVNASRGKYARAEPVAALYEQGRVHHVGKLARLEDEMTTYVPGVSKGSPNRMDALVWALTELFFGASAAEAEEWATQR